MISIVVPTLNEEANIRLLAARIHVGLEKAGIDYEIIFIDDHSTDNTQEVIKDIQEQYPIQLHLKRGKRGKAQSLLEGFNQARYDIIAMIDADLQYPPEAIAKMAHTLLHNQADIIVANRAQHQTNSIRKTFSKTFRHVFGKWLHNLDCDVQSGLKVFRKEIIERIELAPSQWTFDLEFLLQARQAGYSIASQDITFAKRNAGEAKVNVLSSSVEIGFHALKAKITSPKPIMFSQKQQSDWGIGFHYNGQKYVTHTQLTQAETALHRLSPAQGFVIGLLAAVLTSSLILNWLVTVQMLLGILTLFYLLDLFFNMYMVARSLDHAPEINITAKDIKAYDKAWPKYTIFCPLYKEAQVLPQFTKAMSRLDYPQDQLEVLLLLEADDKATVKAAQAMDLPDFFKIVVTPDANPKTKPKACNYGLQHATGEFAVIYDAEDKPEPKQLKKAVVAFDRLGKKTACIQAKLNYYNPNQNWLTRLFTLEYSLWFGLTLPGLQSINAPIPLGGTSNHFRTADLRRLEGWDPFNVTEDADLGMRLFKRGYLTAVMDSFTMEEANSHFWNWIRQRSRWIKGYMQTYLVHMRRPQEFLTVRERALHFITFQFIIGGKILSLLINPLLWLTTILYFVIPMFMAPILNLLLLPWVFYLGTISLVIGNFFYVYLYMIGMAKREHWGLIKYTFLIPFYWLMMSIAALYALRDLFVRPHHWQKTQHGLHLQSKKEPKASLTAYLSRVLPPLPRFNLLFSRN